MAKWMPCGENFIVGDVLRWKEPVWKPRAKRGRGKVIGERLIVAQVLAELDDGAVSLTVKQSETKRGEYWLKALPPELKTGEQIKRRRVPMLKGGLERYQWGGTDGEAVRGMLTSKFTKAVEDGKS